jgi:hypothetical protein
MAEWNVIENDTVVNVIIADTIDLVPCEENQYIEENVGQAWIGYKKVDGVWLHPQKVDGTWVDNIDALTEEQFNDIVEDEHDVITE